MYAAHDTFEQNSICPSEAPVLANGFGEPDSFFSVSQLISSVVSEAGLNRFVYLEGQSGKRFVFSSITRDQASLYNRAVFAACRPGQDDIRVGSSVDDVSDFGSLLYVHLLDESAVHTDEVLRDLSSH